MAETYNQMRERQIRESSAYASLGASANANAAGAAALRARIRQTYEPAIATTDPVAFAMLFGNNELDMLRTQVRSDGSFGGTQLGYLQALLRSTGLSKGTTPIGSFSIEDYVGFQKAVKSGYVNGVDYFSFLEDFQKGGGFGGGTKYNKSITTAINLIDKTDAKTEFSKGYYLAYGKYPTGEQVTNFMNRFNKRAVKEAASTTQSGTTTTAAGGTSGKTKITTSGRGFTAQEQANFLARQLIKMGVPITEEVGGAAKELLDGIRETYSNNGLAEPEFNSMVNIVKDIIGTGDTEISKQKLADAKQKIRDLAAKLNPGLAEQLAKGEDVKTYADQYIKLAESITRKRYSMSDPVIKQLLNLKDDKGNFRPASEWEAYQIMRQTPEWETSPDAFSAFSSIGDRLIAKLGLG